MSHVSSCDLSASVHLRLLGPLAAPMHCCDSCDGRGTPDSATAKAVVHTYQGEAAALGQCEGCPMTGLTASD